MGWLFSYVLFWKDNLAYFINEKYTRRIRVRAPNLGVEVFSIVKTKSFSIILDMISRVSSGSASPENTLFDKVLSYLWEVTVTLFATKLS